MTPPRVGDILDMLESRYGKQRPGWPTDPYQFLVWWHCGYPASEERCAKGWAALIRATGIEPEALLRATRSRLTRALRAGGMVPELRARRLQEIAERVLGEFEGNLAAALKGSLSEMQTRLRSFPGIGPPGADRILLFSGAAPVAAVPSNAPHVLVRVLRGPEGARYTATYKAAQQLIETDVPARLAARRRAYLLLKRHGQELCRAARPRCGACPLAPSCAFLI